MAGLPRAAQAPGLELEYRAGALERVGQSIKVPVSRMGLATVRLQVRLGKTGTSQMGSGPGCISDCRSLRRLVGPSHGGFGAWRLHCVGLGVLPWGTEATPGLASRGNLVTGQFLTSTLFYPSFP